MSEQKEIVALQEADLQLVVSDKTLGTLTTNAETLRELVKQALPKYAIENYSTDDIAKAKADKTLLNKAAKALNDKRIEIEREWMKPFGDFKSVVTDTVGLIKECVSNIDTIIKQDEERTKAEKRSLIEAYYAEKQYAEIVPLTGIFSDKWLNKTATMKSVQKEIDERIEGIKSDLNTLKTFAEDYDVLVTYYLEHLNLNEAVAYANKLKEQREATKAKEEPVAEQAPTNEEPAKEEQKEEAKPETKRVDNHESDAADAFAFALGQSVEPQSPVCVTKTYKVICSEELASELEQFMANKGINFQIL